MTTKTKRTVGVRKTHTLHSFKDQKLVDLLTSVMGWKSLDQYKVYRYLQSDRGTNIQKREGFLDINKNFTSEKHLFYTETIWISSVNLKGRSKLSTEAKLKKLFKESYGLDLSFSILTGRMIIMNVGGIKRVYKQIPTSIKNLYVGYAQNRFEKQANTHFHLNNMSKATFNNQFNDGYIAERPKVIKEKVVLTPQQKKEKKELYLKEFHEFQKENKLRRNRKKVDVIKTDEEKPITKPVLIDSTKISYSQDLQNWLDLMFGDGDDDFGEEETMITKYVDPKKIQPNLKEYMKKENLSINPRESYTLDLIFDAKTNEISSITAWSWDRKGEQIDYRNDCSGAKTKESLLKDALFRIM